ncbi:hypothetical protein U1Q18_008317, partial [Sarracenia purpurea var. burkii]
MAFDLGAIDAMACVLLSCALELLLSCAMDMLLSSVMCHRIVVVKCHKIVPVKFCAIGLVLSTSMGIATFAICVMGLCLQPLQYVEFGEPMVCRFGVVVEVVFAAQFGAAIE